MHNHFSLRGFIDIINEAIEDTPVTSSHLRNVYHNGDKMYIKFWNDVIYEYDDVPESTCAEMLSRDSKGKYFWRYIRDPGKPGGNFPYRIVNKIPDEKPHYKWNWKSQTWEPAVRQKTPKVVPVGTTVQTSDGNLYIWRGAQWVSKVTGRIAKRDVGKALTSQALKNLP